jgi:hypothetical protein
MNMYTPLVQMVVKQIRLPRIASRMRYERLVHCSNSDFTNAMCTLLAGCVALDCWRGGVCGAGRRRSIYPAALHLCSQIRISQVVRCWWCTTYTFIILDDNYRAIVNRVGSWMRLGDSMKKKIWHEGFYFIIRVGNQGSCGQHLPARSSSSKPLLRRSINITSSSVSSTGSTI